MFFSRADTYLKKLTETEETEIFANKHLLAYTLLAHLLAYFAQASGEISTCLLTRNLQLNLTPTDLKGPINFMF